MRHLAALITIFCASACTGSAEDPPEQPPVVPDPVVDDTGWPPGDLANIHVAHHVTSGATVIYGAFTQSSPPYVNMAECAIRKSPCVTGFPDEEEWEEIDDEQEVDTEQTLTRFAGFEIDVGPFKVPYREDETGFGYYELDVTGEDVPEGWLGVSWAGQWPEYEGEQDLFVTPPIEIIQPAAASSILFTNGDVVPIEWVPTGEGVVTLKVSTRFSLARMYLLEDDGYFALDAESLALSGDTEDLTFVLTRWSTNELIYKGHVVNLVASSDVQFIATYLQIGTRTRIFPADECAEAQGAPPLEAGEWWGNLGGRINNQTAPSNNCLQGPPGSAANGNDAIFRVDVPGHYSVSVNYNLFTESASVYFLNDCTDTSSCIAGNDQSLDPNIPEFLSFFNADDPSDPPRQIYLVIDSTELGSSIFTLDVTKSELLPPDMYDTCEQAMAATPTLTTGTYYADFVGGYTSGLDPGPAGCTGTSLPNPDAMTPITLQPNETITASAQMPGGDVGLYLLFNCEEEFSCAAGSDVGLMGASEQVVYQNTALGTENLFLVIDAKSSLQPYFLNVNIVP